MSKWINCSGTGEETNLRNIIYLYLSICQKIYKASLQRDSEVIYSGFLSNANLGGFFFHLFFFSHDAFSFYDTSQT